MRRLVLAGILAALIAAPAAAQESPVVGPGEMPAGRSLTDWEIAWNRWLFGFTRTTLESDGDCLPQPGEAPVRFLAARSADMDAHVVSTHCEVPATSYLLLGVPQVECTDVYPTPGYPLTDRGLQRCARHFWHEFTDPRPRLVLDGRPIPNGSVVRTRVFRFSMPARDNAFGRPGVRRGRAALVGRVAIVRPLAPGHHTLIQGIRYRGYHNTALVYELDVV